jgi:hypothetical protein
VRHTAAPRSRLAVRHPLDLAPAFAEALAAVDRRLGVALHAVPAPHRDRQRADGGWSAHQLLDHIALSAEGYLLPLAQLAATLAAHPAADAPDWRPTLAGRLLVRSLTLRLPLRAPRAIRPGPAPRSDPLARVHAAHTQLRCWCRQVAGSDWGAATMRSPYAGWVRLTFGDAVLVQLRHAERHAGQLERLAAPGALGRASG